MTTVSLKSNTSTKGKLLKIGEAAKALFVSEQTLRDWTDQDKVTAYLSEGGHRNYYEADISRLAYENRGITSFHQVSGLVSFSPDGTVEFKADLSNEKYSDLQEVEWGKYWDFKNGLEKLAHKLALEGSPIIDIGRDVYSDNTEELTTSIVILALTKEEAISLIPKMLKNAKERVLTRYSPKQITRWVDNETGRIIITSM